jgi:hypothetical protein
MGSEYKSDFVKDLASMKLNEGWTVTYWSLQVLYYIGCQQVVIVGMDHSFKQSGKPGKLEVFKGPDVNHFDESYFAGKQWHLAGLQNNERYYRIAKKQFEQAGRKIIDATVGGKCNVRLHPSVSASYCPLPLVVVARLENHLCCDAEGKLLTLCD